MSLLLLIRNLCEGALNRANLPKGDFRLQQISIENHAVEVLDAQRLRISLLTRDGLRTFHIIIQEQ